MVEGGARLLRDELGGLVEDRAPLRVTEDDIGNLRVGKLSGARRMCKSIHSLSEYSCRNAPDLASERTAGLEVAVLGRDLDLLADLLGDGDHVESRGSNHDLCGVQSV